MKQDSPVVVHVQGTHNLEETIVQVLKTWPHRRGPERSHEGAGGPSIEELILPVMRRQPRPGYEIRSVITRMIELGSLRSSNNQLTLPPTGVMPRLFEE